MSDIEHTFLTLSEFSQDMSEVRSLDNFLALGLDRDLGFSWGHQGHRPHDDDDEEEEDKEVEDNDKDNDNNKDDKNDKSISSLGLDRDLGFSRGHQERQGH